MHPQYNRNTLSDDLALIKLPTSFSINEYVQTIALPASSEDFANKICNASGWGRTTEGIKFFLLKQRLSSFSKIHLLLKMWDGNKYYLFFWKILLIACLINFLRWIGVRHPAAHCNEGAWIHRLRENDPQQRGDQNQAMRLLRESTERVLLRRQWRTADVRWAEICGGRRKGPRRGVFQPPRGHLWWVGNPKFEHESFKLCQLAREKNGRDGRYNSNVPWIFQ